MTIEVDVGAVVPELESGEITAEDEDETDATMGKETAAAVEGTDDGTTAEMELADIRPEAEEGCATFCDVDGSAFDVVIAGTTMADGDVTATLNIEDEGVGSAREDSEMKPEDEYATAVHEITDVTTCVKLKLTF